MKRLLTFCLLGGFWWPVFSQTANDSLINLLRTEIARKQIYVQQKLDRIERLRRPLAQMGTLSPEKKFDVYNALYHQYKTFIYDSAFSYADKLIATAYALGDSVRIDYARIKLSFILISSGMFKETFDSLDMVDPATLPDSSKVDYYRLLARAYSDLNIYNHDRHYRKEYLLRDLSNMDSAMRWCPQRSHYYYYLSAVKSLHAGDPRAAIATMLTVLKDSSLTHPQRAMNCFDLGNAFRATGDIENCIRYTALASLSDIRAATKETAAMHSLARILYERGDIENAYVFINQALDDAEFYGARQRKVEIGSILPLIASARMNTVEHQRKIWVTYSSALTVLAVLVLFFAVIIFRQVKKLKAAERVIIRANGELQAINQKLQEADKIKEEYIGYYFGNSSEYIDKMESFRNTVDKKIQAKKVDDLRYVVSTINPAHDREALYVNFDKIFLKLFPDFVTTFNSFFLPEDRVVLKENQLLNTELRIFALIRLGIHDAEKIARILGYSVNTIYAYKNRIKSRSIIPNEAFEARIMDIKTVPGSGT